MKTKIYLIRHGESEYNKHYSHLIGGQSNHSPLTEEGVNQAKLLGEYLLKNNVIFDKVYASPAIRAIGTAKIALSISKHPLEEIVISDQILELDQGEWVGKNREQIYSYQSVIDKVTADPWNFAAPGGESQKQVEERMLKFIHENILDKNYKRVAIFGHGLAIKCLFRGIMDSHPKNTYRIRLDNTSITEFAYNGKDFNLIRLNDISHLR